MQHILETLKEINNELSSGVDIVNVVDPQALEKVLAQLNLEAVYICVAGRYNTGKSTLINALLRLGYVRKRSFVCASILPSPLKIVLPP